MHKLIIIVTALALGGCATLEGFQNPFAGGKFDAAVWKADMVKIKAAAKQGGQAALDTMDALCPSVSQASAAVTDPVYVGTAQAVFGVNGSTKALSNISDGLRILADACAVRDAKTAAQAIVLGAQAINDARLILAAAGK